MLVSLFYLSLGKPSPDRAGNSYKEANDLFAKGDKVAAEGKYREAIVLNPEHPFAWANLGNVLRDRGEGEEALECHLKARQLTPDRPRSAYNLGISLHGEGFYEAAEREYKHAIQLTGDSSAMVETIKGHMVLDLARVYSNLGVSYQAQGRLEEAAGAFDAALGHSAHNRAASLNLCNVLLPLRGAPEAIACFKDLVHRDPEFTQALGAAAGVFHLENHHREAASLYRRVLDIAPNNAAAEHGLAALSGDSGTAQAPAEYVRDMFDAYAPSFDLSLAELKYVSPTLLRQAVDLAVAPGGPAEKDWPAEKGPSSGKWRVMDAGCGTGLCGPLFKNLSSHLAGIDLSQRMIDRARDRRIYDHLEVAEVAQGVRKAGQGSLELIIAADVVVYIGDLGPFLEASAGALKGTRGLLAFTTEAATEGEGGAASEGGGWKLTISGRFAHQREYVLKAAKATGSLEMITAQECTPRWNRGEPVEGHLYMFRSTL